MKAILGIFSQKVGWAYIDRYYAPVESTHF